MKKYWNCQHPPTRYKDQLNSVSVLIAGVCQKLSIFQINKIRISLRVLAIKGHVESEQAQNTGAHLYYGEIFHCFVGS